ncbi:uncharacterized protein VICG_01435 [Vittaforma corneae ATCC 50505]|uniref:Uncharacterized protein n=1 Tax=Vittaforma corneae (strain ATCC 50505) TaxID=993615 RepID=L2GL41_VITCO|nr:uncharacterized protein VICG_01435 [Vittaforma corneae ATCC 50505]ELA41571.1 hypothetical protein VICG_01435 [Vittaforma corneae ATCC 50505]
MITSSFIRIFHIFLMLNTVDSSFLDLSKRKQFELGVPIDILRSDICQFVNWAQSRKNSLSDSSREALGKLKVLYLSEIEKCINKGSATNNIKSVVCSQPLSNPGVGLSNSCIGTSAFDIAEITDSFQQKTRSNGTNKILILTSSEAEALTPNPNEKVLSSSLSPLQQPRLLAPCHINNAMCNNMVGNNATSTNVVGLAPYNHKKAVPVSVVYQTLTKTLLKVKHPATLTQTLTRSIIIPIQKPPVVQTILKPIFRYFIRSIPITKNIPYAEPVFITKNITVPSISTVFLPVSPDGTTIASNIRRKVLQRIPLYNTNSIAYSQACGIDIQCNIPKAVSVTKPFFYTPSSTVSNITTHITTMTQIILQPDESKKRPVAKDLYAIINDSARNSSIRSEMEKMMSNLSEMQRSTSASNPVPSYINTSTNSIKNTSVVTKRVTIYRNNNTKDKTVTISFNQALSSIVSTSSSTLHTVYSTVISKQNSNCQLCEDEDSENKQAPSTHSSPVNNLPLAIDDPLLTKDNAGELNRIERPNTVTITNKIIVTVTKNMGNAEVDRIPQKAFRIASNEPASTVSIQKKTNEPMSRPTLIESSTVKSTSLTTVDKDPADSSTANNISLIKTLNELEMSLKESNELNKQLAEKVIEALRIDREMHSIVASKQAASFTSLTTILSSKHNSSSTLTSPGSKQSNLKKNNANPLAEILNLLSGNDKQSYLVEPSSADASPLNSATTAANSIRYPQTVARSIMKEYPDYKNELLNELMAFITKDTRSEDDIIRILNLIRLVKQYNKMEISMNQSGNTPELAANVIKEPNKREKDFHQTDNSSIPAVKLVGETNVNEKIPDQATLQEQPDNSSVLAVNAAGKKSKSEIGLGQADNSTVPAIKTVTILVNNEESVETKNNQSISQNISKASDIINSISKNTVNSSNDNVSSTGIHKDSQNMNDVVTSKYNSSASINSISTKTLTISHTLIVTTTIQKREQAKTSTIIQPVVSIKPEIHRETKTLVRTVTVFRNSQVSAKNSSKAKVNGSLSPGQQSIKTIDGRSYVLPQVEAGNVAGGTKTMHPNTTNDKTITHQDLAENIDIHNHSKKDSLEPEIKNARVAENNQKYKIIEIRETEGPNNSFTSSIFANKEFKDENTNTPGKMSRKKIKSAELTLENLVDDNPKIISIDLPVEQISEVLKQIPG